MHAGWVHVREPHADRPNVGLAPVAGAAQHLGSGVLGRAAQRPCAIGGRGEVPRVAVVDLP